MSKFLLIIIFCSFTFLGICQNRLIDLIPKEAVQLNSFVPKGWLKLDSASGDFNKDGIKDYALVIIDSISEKVLEDVNRSLIILEGLKKGYKLSGYCDSAILCFACGGVHGDPYQGIEFNKNVLLIYHYGGSAWRWLITNKFRFQNNSWYLIGQTNYSYWDLEKCKKLNEFAGTNYEDVNFITGQFEIKKISQDCKLLENKKGKRAIKPLTSLNNFNIDN